MLGIADTSGMIHRVNPAWEVTLGRPVRDFEGRPMLEFLHPDDRESTFAALDELAGGQPVTGFVNRQRHRDGTYRLLEWRVTPQAGGLIFAIGRDITAKVEALEREAALQREAEDQLRRSGAYNRSLIEASLDPLVTIGPDGMITDVNEATVTATGLPREELVGTDFAEYFTEPVRARAGYEQAFREGHVRDYPLEMRHRSGRLTDVLYNASTYSDPEGKVAGVFAAARDIGELKKAEAEIRALNATLEGRVEERTRELAAANTELHEFVYSVSHDLRTPLRAIDGFSQTVLDDYGAVIDEQGRSDLQRVRAAAQRMGELIDALLALSRVGHRDIAPRQVDLTAIARRVIEELREAEPERQVVVAVEEGLLAEADPALADVILENLIGNAWKFTADRPAAHISVGATRDEASRAGAPRFQRLHTAEQFPGTGIGLATVARVLSRIGGTWRAEGTVDEGATFFFTLGDGGDPG